MKTIDQSISMPTTGESVADSIDTCPTAAKTVFFRRRRSGSEPYGKSVSSSVNGSDGNYVKILEFCEKIFEEENYGIIQGRKPDEYYITILKKDNSLTYTRFARLKLTKNQTWHCKLYGISPLPHGATCIPKPDYFEGLDSEELKTLLSNTSDLAALFGIHSDQRNPLIGIKRHALVRRKYRKDITPKRRCDDYANHSLLLKTCPGGITSGNLAIDSTLNHYKYTQGKKSSYFSSTRADTTLETLKGNVRVATADEGINEHLSIIVLISLVDAITRLSSEGFIHTDIHSSNVLVYKHMQPNIRLHDFGNIRRSGITMRTLDPQRVRPHYAPEHYVKSTEEGYSIAQDIWSVAVCTLESISEHKAFIRHTLKRILERYITLKNNEARGQSSRASMFSENEHNLQNEVHTLIDSILSSEEGLHLKPFGDILKTMLRLSKTRRGILDDNLVPSSNRDIVECLYAEILAQYIKIPNEIAENAHLKTSLEYVRRLPQTHREVKKNIFKKLGRILSKDRDAIDRLQQLTVDLSVDEGRQNSTDEQTKAPESLVSNLHYFFWVYIHDNYVDPATSGKNISNIVSNEKLLGILTEAAASYAASYRETSEDMNHDTTKSIACSV